MRYGFRVFSMTAHLNGRGDPVEWGERVVAELQSTVATLASAGTLQGTPYIRTPRAELADEDQEGRRHEDYPPATTFIDPVWVNERHLHLVVSYGRYGSHRDLHRATGASDDISGDAPGARHRVDILIPAGGTTALVVTETVAGATPVAVVQAHLTSRTRKDAQVPGSPREYTRPWHSFRMNGHPDAAYLRAIIDDASTATAVFKDTELTSRGRTRRVSKKLEIDVKETKKRDAAVKNAESWLDALTQSEGGDGHRRSHGEAVSQMIDDFGLDRDSLDALSLHFDDVALVIDNGSGKPRIFTPSAVRQIFTYPVGPAEPQGEVYYDRVGSRVHDLVAQYGYEIAPVDVGEVLEACRTDSAQGLSSEPL